MNIFTLCRCAERYELLCHVVDDYEQAAEIGAGLGVNGEDLWNFIYSGEDESIRGTRLVRKMEHHMDWCINVLLHENFYEVVEEVINR